jgi:glycosyltransferase involved in cell wall biosynthesis
MRVLLLNNLPAPYFIPLFRQLAGVREWQLTICFATAWKPDLGWAERSISPAIPARTVYLNQYWRHRGWWWGGERLLSVLAMLDLLRRERPDYLICYGYTLLPQLTLLLWALVTATPFALIGDANIHCDRTSGLKRQLKRAWLKRLTRQAAAILTIGTANRLFWERYGAGPGKLFRVPFAVDNDYFERETESRRNEAWEKRRALGLADRVVFISVGRLVERKNIDLLIRAMKELREDEPAALLIAGTGEESGRLKSLAADDPRIIFLGGVVPAELPVCYGMADVMILAARDEPWGLVTNEAMACGLALIGQRECGSTVDLVGADNGVVLSGFSVEELVAAMRRLIHDDELRQRMQQASRLKIREWSIEAAARGLVTAVEATIHPGSSGPEVPEKDPCNPL